MTGFWFDSKELKVPHFFNIISSQHYFFQKGASKKKLRGCLRSKDLSGVQIEFFGAFTMKLSIMTKRLF